jgi:hypothetical protein
MTNTIAAALFASLLDKIIPGRTTVAAPCPSWCC